MRTGTKGQAIQRPKGMPDTVGADADAWRAVQQEAMAFLRRAGYQEMNTPILEHTELFHRGVGESTDIVNKEMFTFEKGDRSLTLRPEGTAGVVRAFIENGLHRWPKPVKLAYFGPMFRYERPQEGRQRQFHQLGCELFGQDTPEADAEVILLAVGLLEHLGVEGITLHINTVGEADDRQRFRDALKQQVAPYLDELCPDCQRRYGQNPLRMLDCKVPSCRAHYDGEAMSAFLAHFPWSQPSYGQYQQTLAILSACGVTYVENPRLVRGLDYYTRTVFEITGERLGAQNAVCGGGRYNQLVEGLGGPNTPAIGWAMGVERLHSLMPTREKTPPLFYIVHDDAPSAFALAQWLRQQPERLGWGGSASETAGKLMVECDLSGKPLGKQFQAADKRLATAVIIWGESERSAGQYRVKWLADGRHETATSQDELLAVLMTGESLPGNTRQ